jgi:hypothetical protein
VALILVAVSMSATALCATLACPAAVSLSSCHSVPSGPRLSDCCAAHSSSTVVSESRIGTVAGPRLTSWAAPVAPAPASTALVVEPSSDHGAVISLFTLHRSLLL